MGENNNTQTDTTETKSVIKIVLDNSRHAKTFERDYLIHKDKFNETIELIKRALVRANDEPNKKYLHDTITILGTRGSGKTSFLLSILEELANASKKGGEKNSLADIQLLEIIDPTLIEEKGHVFLNVISLINDIIDSRLNQQECMSNENAPEFNRKRWRSVLNKLAAGLPSIDGISSNNTDSWQDPEFVMDKGLTNVSASQKLAANFNEFLRISLGILEKKAFLLVFDDIDVDSSKGWAVLETIRKYFTGTRLITLLSGEPSLYSSLVRQKKWENLGKEFLKFEGKMQNQIVRFNERITELEEQYLQKIMQTNLRIHIPTLEQKFKQKENEVILVVHSDLTETPLQDYYYGILKYFGIGNSFQASTYFFFLLRQPLRTQIQFMSLFLKKNDLYLLEDPGRLTDVFFGNLLEKRINIHLISLSEIYLISEVLSFLLRENRLFEAYQLQPTTTDNSVNIGLTALNFLLAHRIRNNNSYLIFEYFIKIGYVRNIYPVIMDSSGKNVQIGIDGLCSSANLFNDGIYRDQVGLIIAYMRAFVDFTTQSSEYKLRTGTIPLYGEKSKRKQKLEALSNRIDSELNGKDLLLKKIVYIPLSANQYGKKHSSLLTYSIYMLIATIAEVLKRNSNSNDMPNDLLELSQLRSYIMPDFAGANDDQEDPETEESTLKKEKKSANELESAFIKNFQDWMAGGNELSVNPHVIGKISTRLAYAIDNIETAYTGKKELGEVFHAQIVSFLNAVLIEDVRENVGAEGLTLNNTRFSDKIFINNIKSQLIESDTGVQVEMADKLRFSRWILKCPLLICYLNLSEKTQVPKKIAGITNLAEALTIYCSFKEDSFNELKNYSVFSILEKVSIRNKNRALKNTGNKSTSGKLDKKTSLSLSLGAQTQYEAIKEKIKEAEIPLSLFEKTSKSQTIKNNREIQKKLNSLNIGRVSAANIATFRNFIEETKTK